MLQPSQSMPGLDRLWQQTQGDPRVVIAVLDGMVREGTLDEDWPMRSIEVLNKADLLGGIRNVTVKSGGIAVSAITGEGLDALMQMIDARIAAAMEVIDYAIPAADGAKLAWLYQHGEVISRTDDDELVRVQVRLLPADRARFEQP